MNPDDDIKSSGEEDASGDEDQRTDGRRRRFCIERQLQQKKAKLDAANQHQPRPRSNIPHNIHKHLHNKPFHQPRRNHRLAQLDIKAPLSDNQLKGPVIFINPKFVKNFIEKTIKLAPSSSSTGMIEEIDFKTTPKECLQAASTMAIIRLVTECIEDDDRRDEKLNKILVARLISELKKDEMPNLAEQLDPKDSPISEDNGGQPIPVIGGSVNHFNSRIKTQMCRRRALRHQ